MVARVFRLKLAKLKGCSEGENVLTAVKVKTGESQPQKIGTDHCLVG
jgi:hypothetical protein